MTHHTFHFPKTVAGWKREALKAVEVIKLNKTAMNKIAADPKAAGPALAFILGSSFILSLGYYVFPQQILWVTYRVSFGYVISSTLAAGVGIVIFGAILGLIAEHILKGKGSLMSYLQVLGYGSLISVVGIFPSVEYLSGLWMLVVAIVGLKAVYKL